MHGIDGPARRAGRDRGEKGGIRDTETRLLAFHVAVSVVEGKCGHCGAWPSFQRIRGGDAGNQQEGHGRQENPALLLVSGHATEGVGQRGGDAQDEQHLDEIGEGRRVLERMGAVGVEETAAVGAQFLDHLL